MCCDRANNGSADRLNFTALARVFPVHVDRVALRTSLSFPGPWQSAHRSRTPPESICDCSTPNTARPVFFIWEMALVLSWHEEQTDAIGVIFKSFVGSTSKSRRAYSLY